MSHDHDHTVDVSVTINGEARTETCEARTLLDLETLTFANGTVHKIRLQYLPAKDDQQGAKLGWVRLWMNDNLAPVMQAQVDGDKLRATFGGAAFVGFTAGSQDTKRAKDFYDRLVADYPDLATWTDIGDSWEKSNGLGGFDIFVLKLTNSAIDVLKPRRRPAEFQHSLLKLNQSSVTTCRVSACGSARRRVSGRVPAPPSTCCPAPAPTHSRSC